MVILLFNIMLNTTIIRVQSRIIYIIDKCTAHGRNYIMRTNVKYNLEQIPHCAQ